MMLRFVTFVDGSNLDGVLKHLNLRVDDYGAFYRHVFEQSVHYWGRTFAEGAHWPTAQHSRIYWYVVGKMDEWDLNDAKAEARDRVCAAASSGDYGAKEVTIRVNGLDTEWHAADIAAAAQAGPAAVVVPKVNSVEDVHAIEAGLGRTRDIPGGPRTMDIDLVVVGRRQLQTETLTLPHPRAHERAFVLVPWQEIDPGAELPGIGSIDDLVASVDASGVRRSDETVELP